MITLSFVKYTMSMFDTIFVVHLISIRFVYLFLQIKKKEEEEKESEREKKENRMMIF